MHSRSFRVIFCLLMVLTLLAARVFAQETKELTLEEQLKSIIEGQKRIEKKLSVIESRQMGIIRNMRNIASKPPAAARPSIDPSKVYKIDIDHSPIRGKKDAKVTIVVFSEIQCPYSKRFQPVINEVLKAYPNDVNHIFKHFPLRFHSQAKPGAKAILAAGKQGKYWEMLDLLFEKGTVPRIQGESPEDLAKRLEEHYKSLAKELRLKVRKFMKDYKNKDADWEKIITKDMELGKKVNVRGTPTFFINGRITRARNLQSFKTEIDSILKGKEVKPAGGGRRAAGGSCGGSK